MLLYWFCLSSARNCCYCPCFSAIFAVRDRWFLLHISSCTLAPTYWFPHHLLYYCNSGTFSAFGPISHAWEGPKISHLFQKLMPLVMVEIESFNRSKSERKCNQSKTASSCNEMSVPLQNTLPHFCRYWKSCENTYPLLSKLISSTCYFPLKTANQICFD